jgi:hypothetical protein
MSHFSLTLVGVELSALWQFLLNLGPMLPPGGRNWQLMGAALIRLTEHIFYKKNNVILITFNCFNHSMLLKKYIIVQ